MDITLNDLRSLHTVLAFAVFVGIIAVMSAYTVETGNVAPRVNERGAAELVPGPGRSYLPRELFVRPNSPDWTGLGVTVLAALIWKTASGL